MLFLCILSICLYLFALISTSFSFFLYFILFCFLFSSVHFFLIISFFPVTFFFPFPPVSRFPLPFSAFLSFPSLLLPFLLPTLNFSPFPHLLVFIIPASNFPHLICPLYLLFPFLLLYLLSFRSWNKLNKTFPSHPIPPHPFLFNILSLHNFLFHVLSFPSLSHLFIHISIFSFLPSFLRFILFQLVLILPHFLLFIYHLSPIKDIYSLSVFLFSSFIL